MEAQSLSSHQHSWWFSCFSLREKLAWSYNKKAKLARCSKTSASLRTTGPFAFYILTSIVYTIFKASSTQKIKQPYLKFLSHSPSLPFRV